MPDDTYRLSNFTLQTSHFTLINTTKELFPVSLPRRYLMNCFVVLLLLLSRSLTEGFLHSNVNQRIRTTVELGAEQRRDFLARIAVVGNSAVLMSTLLPSASSIAVAAAEQQSTVYNTGKAPIVPGQAPKDKSDTKGTKRDPNFLRSISDCKAQCEQSNGPDGYARSKEECLELCQDICCKTYEQCTFAITPR